MLHSADIYGWIFSFIYFIFDLVVLVNLLLIDALTRCHVAFVDTGVGPWDDPHWSVEAKTVSHPMSAAGLQPQEHISSLHGGECEMWNDDEAVLLRNDFICSFTALS